MLAQRVMFFRKFCSHTHLQVLLPSGQILWTVLDFGKDSLRFLKMT